MAIVNRCFMLGIVVSFWLQSYKEDARLTKLFGQIIWSVQKKGLSLHRLSTQKRAIIEITRIPTLREWSGFFLFCD